MSQAELQPQMQAPSPIDSPRPEVANDPRTANRARFELELEFVQALANPFYLHTLSQQGILAQPAFVNYLEYLMYWKEKDYARFILYPHALHHLELLQHATFRSEIGKDEWREYLNQKQFDHWRTWREPKHLVTTSATTNGASPGQSHDPSGDTQVQTPLDIQVNGNGVS